MSDKGELACTECDGEGEVDHECDCELCDEDFEDCTECHGTGLNPNLVDIKAYWKAATMTVHDLESWEWPEDGRFLGRIILSDADERRRVAVVNYVKDSELAERLGGKKIVPSEGQKELFTE